MSHRLKWDIRFLRLAREISTWSKDPSTKTGAVIVRPDRSIVSSGYNGFPRDMMDTDYLYANREEKYSRIVPCEMNALIHAYQRLDYCTLYTWPFLSCDRCMVHMIQAGIKRFVAPVASDDALSRWGAAFERTKQYAREAAVAVVEIDPSWLEPGGVTAAERLHADVIAEALHA
jgi:dCMP deaminase